MADDLIPVMQQVAGAAEAVLKAWQRARADGQVERVVSLNLAGSRRLITYGSDGELGQ